VELHNYIKMKFITCQQYCLICDKDLDLASNFKLPVCSDKECVKTYESSSCGGCVINDIKTQPEVVDLLLCFLATVAQAKGFIRGRNIGGFGLETTNATYRNFNKRTKPQQQFEPFPHNMGFNHTDGSQDAELLVETIQKIPKISEMQKYASDDQLKVVLDEISPLAFTLLRWVVRSNRTHLELIPKKRQLKDMKTDLQFNVVSSFPEHERKFQDWKGRARNLSKNSKSKKNSPNSSGSYYAFHGSPITNFHSIIRTGLRGGFVPGIYHAQNAFVSFGYMNSGQQVNGWDNSMFKCDGNMSCIAMIEVADMRHDQKLITGGNEVNAGTVNVAMDHSLVVTRFLFFYPTGTAMVNNTQFNFNNQGIIAEHQKDFANFLIWNNIEDSQKKDDDMINIDDT